MNLAVLELDRLEQRPAQAHDDRPFDLVLQVVRVEDRAALERRRRPARLALACRSVDRDFGARGDVAALLRAARDAEAAARRRLRLPQPNCFAAASSTARSRSSFRFFRRNSSGSMADGVGQVVHVRSRGQNVLAVAASARYEPCRSGESVRWNSITGFGTSYGVRIAEPPEL